MKKSRARSALALVLIFGPALLAAAPAFAQQEPSPAPAPVPPQSQLSDEQKWAQQIEQTVPADELDAAAADAEAQQSGDPLMKLAAKYHFDVAPDWLKGEIQEQSNAATLASLGDSVTAGMASCKFPYYYCPGNSWSTGDLPTSLRRQLADQSGRDVRGFLVAVPGVKMSSIPAESFVVFLASAFGLNVERMTLLIGHNDPGVCGAPAAGAQEAFEKKFATSLRILAHVARARGAKLFVSSLVEVTMVAQYADVIPAGATKKCSEIWAEVGRCQGLLAHRDDPSVFRRAAAQIAAYDASLSRLSAGKDWVLYTPTLNASTMDGFPNPVAELSPLDCFHPSAGGQARLGQVTWSGDAGAPGIASFFALDEAARAPRTEAAAPKPLTPELSAELDAWRNAGGRPE